MDNPLALIVEDDEDAGIIFSNALHDAGFDTEIIQTGDEALIRLDNVAPDLVVLDLELPRVPGVEILRRIRANVRLAKTQVIIATAFPDMAVGLEDEADLVLIKPVSFAQLRDLATRLGLA
jgi:two-component system sensor histidine kinase/response regulator